MNASQEPARWVGHQFISFDETPIFYHCTTTEGPPKGIVIIIHGMGEHGGRYRAFAEYLAGLGLQSYLPDLRGFGRSDGKRACVRKFSDFHEDLHALQSWVSRTNKETPIFLLGHSLGGLVASSYLSLTPHPKVTGLVLSSPLFGIAIPVPFWKHWTAIFASYLFPDHTEANHVDPSLLTHDAEILHNYEKDPLIFHRISTRLYRELQRTLNEKDRIARDLKSPVLTLQAGEDFIVSKVETLQFYNKIETSEKEFEVYDGFYHEILNEVHRDTVYSRIGLWILKQLRA